MTFVWKVLEKAQTFFALRTKDQIFKKKKFIFKCLKKNPSHELFFEYADIFRQRDFQTKVEKIFWWMSKSTFNAIESLRIEQWIGLPFSFSSLTQNLLRHQKQIFNFWNFFYLAKLLPKIECYLFGIWKPLWFQL